MDPATPALPKRTSKLAVTALVLACLLCLPLVPIIGAILGVVALTRFPSRPELEGRTFAIVAIPVGISSIFISGILAAIAIPGFIQYQVRAIESEARVLVQSIALSQDIHYAVHQAYLAAGPTPASVPEGATEQVFDGPWDELGFHPGYAVRFQYEAIPQEGPDGGPAVLVRARGRPRGSEIVWQVLVTPSGTGELERIPPDDFSR